MPYSLIVFATRKPGTTPEHFQNYWENEYTPLVKSIAGSKFAKSHVHYYVKRNEDPNGDGGQDNSNFPAEILMGDQVDFDYDGFAISTYESEEAFKEYAAVVSHPDAVAKRAEAEEVFVDRTKFKVAVLGNITGAV